MSLAAAQPAKRNFIQCIKSWRMEERQNHLALNNISNAGNTQSDLRTLLTYT